MVTNWERIKKELDSLNLFYSAITGRSDEDNNFRKMGFEEFEHLKIKDKRSEEGENEGEPDFTLLRDNYLCLIEVKSGRNIEPRDIYQSKRNSSFTIEGIREFFRDYKEKSVEITEIDSIFVFYKEKLEECFDIENCYSELGKIMDDSVILSQEKGGKLKFWKESKRTSSPELNEVLEEGIKLDQTPKNEIMLVDNPELENVVVYLQRRFLDRLKDRKEILMSKSELFREFIPDNKQCSRDRVENAMKIIRSLDGATLKQGTDKYRIKRDDVRYLMQIPDVLSKKDGDDILGSQSGGLEEFGVEF